MHIIKQEVIKVAYSERELLARIAQCEAGGEGDNRPRGVCGLPQGRTLPRKEGRKRAQGAGTGLTDRRTPCRKRRGVCFSLSRGKTARHGKA